jgi:predicted RecA/RadA family phage recombinase
MKNYVQKGDVIPVVAGVGGIASGDVVKVGSLIGVAVTSAAQNETASVSLTGVCEVKKKTTDVITQGEPLYWDATNAEMTETASGNTLAGYAWAGAGNGVTKVQIKLLF